MQRLFARLADCAHRAPTTTFLRRILTLAASLFCLAVCAAPASAQTTVTSFTPTSGAVGASVTITGTAFTGATSVTFNATAATFTVVSATSITATVPTGATTGPIAVTDPAGNATSSTNFTVTVPAPTITSFTPTSGAVGASVAINGTNLTGTTVVGFNGHHPTSFMVNGTGTQITTTVPSGATTGKIAVIAPGGEAFSATDFTVTASAPTITSFTPTSGPVGTAVAINGTNLTGTTVVGFNGHHPTSFMVNGAGTQITTTVPTGATTGLIAVIAPGGEAFSSTNFTVTTGSAPTITSFTPTSGAVGASVTITGTAFTGATAVTFSGPASASFTVVSATSITTTVPTGAATGTLSVTTPSGTATSSGTFTVTVPAPTITSFTPTSGPVGTAVAINGTNLTGTTVVGFNGHHPTSFMVNGAGTQITTTVPTGATTGKIAVIAPGGEAFSATNFTVTTGGGAPTITSFTPASGPAGTVVTITGTNFTGATGVTFNGTAAAMFTVVSATSITATVPAGATAGPIVVTTPGGSVMTASIFAAYPQIDCGSTTGFSSGGVVVWGPDNGSPMLTGGTTLITSVSSFANLPAGVPYQLFQNQRQSDNMYMLPVKGTGFTYTETGIANGSYTLNLYFAETAPTVTGPGQRTFNVIANGLQVLTGFDVYATAAVLNPSHPADTVVTESFPITVTNGQMTLTFQDVPGTGKALCGAFALGPEVQPAADIPPPGWAEDVIPSDQSESGGDGPSSSEGVSLPSGVKENTPGPDLDVYNPVGPMASFTRRYRGNLAASNTFEPGLSPGWVDNYDMTVTSLGSGAYRLNYPNGATEAWATVSGTITPPSGTPYLVSLSGTDPVMTFPDHSTYLFTPDPNAANSFLLSKVATIAGSAITVNRDASNGDRLKSVTTDAGTALLTFTYAGNLLASVQDSYARTITYAFDANNNLKSVSQINSPSSLRWMYGYQSINSRYYLNSVQSADPDGTNGLSTAAGTIYDSQGHVMMQVDADSNVRTYLYQPSSVVVSVYGSDGTQAQTWTQKFDPSNKNVDKGMIDANGNASSLIYGDTGNPYKATAAINKNGQMASAAYDKYGDAASTVDLRSVMTSLSYDSGFPDGQVTEITVGSKTSTKLAYYSGNTSVNGVLQPNGLIQSISTPTPGTVGGSTRVATTYVYTAKGEIALVTSPGPSIGGVAVMTGYNYTTDSQYDGMGAPIPNGMPAYTTTEQLGEPLTVTDPVGNVTHFRYDARGNTTIVISPLGNRTDYTYFMDDQIESIQYPATGQQGSGRSHTDYAYYSLGGPLESVSQYDESNTLKRTSLFNNGKEGEDKQHSGSVQQVVNAYDPRYRPQTVTDGNNVKAQSFVYDKVGNPAGVTYALGDGTKFTSFDPDDNLMIRQDGRGILTTYTRAKDDSRITDAAYSDGTTPGVHVDHDVYDRPTHMKDGTGTADWSYDDDDNLLTDTRTYLGSDGVTPLPAKSIAYTYNDDGSRATMATPNGSTTWNFTYGYDNDGRMTTVSAPWRGGGSYYIYDADSRLTRSANAHSETIFTYNARGFLTDEQIGSATSSGIFSQPPPSDARGYALLAEYGGLSASTAIQYDCLGNRIQMAVFIPDLWTYVYDSGSGNYNQSALYANDTDGTYFYVYDSKDRMTLASSADPSGTINNGLPTFEDYQRPDKTYYYNDNYNEAYGYDLADNMTIVQGASFVFNADDQINTYTFDAEGNQTQAMGASGMGGLTYNAEDQATSAPGIAGQLYTGDGLRAWKPSGTGRTYFLYDGGTVVCEMDQTGAPVNTYSYGANGLEQRYDHLYPRYICYTFDPDGNLVHRIRNTDPNFTGVQNVGALVQDTVLYDPYGELHADFNVYTGAFLTPDAVGYGGQGGQYTDIETLNAAAGTYLSSMGGNGIYWDAQTGRWLVRGGDGVNGYDTTNPIRHDDGLFSGRNLSLLAAGVAGGLVGGPVGAAVFHGADEALLSSAEGSPPLHAIERGASATLTDLVVGKVLEVGGALVARSALGRAIGNGIKRLIPNCFVAGTLVQMADGSVKKIEDVREGDFVLSRDPETGVTEAKEVLAHSVKIAPQVLTLTLVDPATRLTQSITCTPGHPFYVQGQGFVLAGSLGIGTSIVTRAGPCLSVASIAYEPKSTGGVPVYNFTVADDHTYFVGTVDGGAWVHNASLKWYGSTELSRRAIQFRFDSSASDSQAFNGRNVAVFKLNDGSLEPYFSDPEREMHAEEVGIESLTNRGRINDVEEVYSELEPCGPSSNNCSATLRSTFPNARVEYSFPYSKLSNDIRVGVVRSLPRFRRSFRRR